MSLLMALPACPPLHPCGTPSSTLLREAFLPASLTLLALLNMASVPKEEPPCLLSPHQSRWSVISSALAMIPSLLPSNGISPCRHKGRCLPQHRALQGGSCQPGT